MSEDHRGVLRRDGLEELLELLGLGAVGLLGGLLTAVSWRLTFAINLPLMVACAVGALVWTDL